MKWVWSFLLASAVFYGEASSHVTAPLLRRPAAGEPYRNRDTVTQMIFDKFRLQCRDMDDPNEDVAAFRQELCACLARGRVFSGAACRTAGTLDQWNSFLQDRLQSEAPVGFSDPTCLRNLRLRKTVALLMGFSHECERSPSSALAQIDALSGLNRSADRCWRMTGMTAEGCITAQSCRPEGAPLNELPAARASNQLAREATLCHPNLQAIHRLKDPNQCSLHFQRPFTQVLLDHPALFRECSYGSPNCHGTAQALGGQVLGEMTVPSFDMAPAYREQCGQLPAEAYQRARARAGGQVPKISDFELEPGGVIINMDHSPTCPVSQCGQAKMYANNCANGRPHAYIFIDQMCVNCWEQKWIEKGYRRMENGSWRDLGPGCVMTASDHTITVLMQNEGFCYYYETPNPDDAPQLRVDPCAYLWGRFPRRLCPSSPLSFSLRDIR